MQWTRKQKEDVRKFWIPEVFRFNRRSTKCLVSMVGEHWTLNIEHWTVNSEQWTLNSEQWTANQTRGQNFCPIFWNLLDYKCIWYIERNNPDWPVVWVEPGRKRWFKSWKAPEVFCPNLESVSWYKVQSRGWWLHYITVAALTGNDRRAAQGCSNVMFSQRADVAANPLMIKTLFFEPRLHFSLELKFNGQRSWSFAIAVTKTCGDVTSTNGTFFQSDGYPSTFDRWVLDPKLYALNL